MVWEQTSNSRRNWVNCQLQFVINVINAGRANENNNQKEEKRGRTSTENIAEDIAFRDKIYRDGNWDTSAYTCSTADSAVTCNAMHRDRPGQTRQADRRAIPVQSSQPRKTNATRKMGEQSRKLGCLVASALIIHTHSLIIVIPCCLSDGGDLIKSISR